MRADFIGHAEVIAVGQLAECAGANSHGAPLTELVAASAVTANLKLVNAGHSVAADLEACINALSNARLNIVWARAGGIVDVFVAHSGVKLHWGGEFGATGVLATRLGNLAVGILAARAGNIQALDTVDTTTLLAARVIEISRVAALLGNLVKALSPQGFNAGSSSRYFRVLGVRAASKGWICERHLLVAVRVDRDCLARAPVIQV